MLGCCFDSFASLRTTQYRWRNDDGNQTTATWKAAANTPITINTINENIRLRMEMDNDNGSGYLEECDGILVYSYDNGATWTEMTNAATDHFTCAPSTNLTHNSNTTSQMTGTTGTFYLGTFYPGKVISALPDLNSWASVDDGGRMEYEWV